MNRRILPTLLTGLLAATTCVAATKDWDGKANVRLFGARGDGKTDNTEAFQAAFDSLAKPQQSGGVSTSGGIVWVPPGKFNVRGPIDVRGENIRIETAGGKMTEGRSAWIYHTGDGPLFRLPHDNRPQHGFTIHNLLVVGTGKASTTAVEIWTGSKFRRNFLFDAMGIQWFGKAISIRRKSGSMEQIGDLVLRDCVIERCRQALVFEQVTSCNRLIIRGNVIRHLGLKASGAPKPALDVHAFGAVISGNMIEGSPWWLHLRDSKVASITDNWSEANALIFKATRCERVRVWGHYCWRPTTQQFQFERCRNVYIDEPDAQVRITDCIGVYRPHYDLSPWVGGGTRLP